MVRRILPAAAIAAALALGACGGDDGGSGGSDTDEVNAAIETSYAAFADLDIETFCDSLSPDYLADFKDARGNCDLENVEPLLSEVSDSDVKAFKDPEISDVQVDGDTATATVNGDDVALVDVDGEWKLDDFSIPGVD